MNQLRTGDKVVDKHGMKGTVIRVRDDIKAPYDIVCADGIVRPGNDHGYTLDPGYRKPIPQYEDDYACECGNADFGIPIETY